MSNDAKGARTRARKTPPPECINHTIIWSLHTRAVLYLSACLRARPDEDARPFDRQRRRRPYVGTWED